VFTHHTKKQMDFVHFVDLRRTTIKKEEGGIQDIGCAGGTNLKIYGWLAQPTDALHRTPGRINDLTAVDACRRAAGSFQPHLTLIPGHVG
jgi:hypothetical protein